MKRDMDLIRAILLKVEQQGGFTIKGLAAAQLSHHHRLVMEAGLVGEDHRLTWKGHEFLDASRDDDRWKAAKEAINRVQGATLEVWQKVLVDMLNQQLVK